MIPKKLLDEISRWIAEKRYGNLQINFKAGRIASINRAESIMVEDIHTSSTVSASQPID